MYYEDAKENAAFERCTDVITNMIMKYGPVLKRKWAVDEWLRNNIEKFDPDFMFELTDDETEYLRTNFSTANISSKSRYNPHVFTEQGLYMLMTVLKGPLAVKQSKALIRTFKKMKDYILENRE